MVHVKNQLRLIFVFLAYLMLILNKKLYRPNL